MNRQWKKCELFEGEKKLIEKNNEGKNYFTYMKEIQHAHCGYQSMRKFLIP